MALILIGLVFASLVVLAAEFGLIKPNTYTENLEAYIERGMPQHPGDVERLTREYEYKHGGKFI